MVEMFHYVKNSKRAWEYNWLYLCQQQLLRLFQTMFEIPWAFKKDCWYLQKHSTKSLDRLQHIYQAFMHLSKNISRRNTVNVTGIFYEISKNLGSKIISNTFWDSEKAINTLYQISSNLNICNSPSNHLHIKYLF